MIKKFHKYFESSDRVYYHGSRIELPIGETLKGGDRYNQEQENSFSIVEKYRPENKLSHREALFMCDDPDKISEAGGNTDNLYTVEPTSEVNKHDLSWVTSIKEVQDEHKIKLMAENFWKGEPNSVVNDPLWVYTTTEAKIVSQQ